MGYRAARDMYEATDFRTAMSWHLSSNHYPPVPASMVQVCMEACALAEAGCWELLIDLPPGIEYRGADEAPVWAIVESFHLEAFIEGDE